MDLLRRADRDGVKADMIRYLGCDNGMTMRWSWYGIGMVMVWYWYNNDVIMVWYGYVRIAE